MRVLQRTDYENLAKEAVAKMVNEKVPLNQSLVKISDSMGLNPDQIKALVQVANTLAHLDLFDRKTDGDKIINFTPADPDEVLKDVVTSPDGCEACGSSMSDMADKTKDFFGDFSSDPAPTSRDALANVGTALNPPTNDPSGRRAQITIIKIRKVAEELKQQKLAALHQYNEERDKLASEFAKLYGPNFEEFEKDAIDVHGADAVPILCEIRYALRLPGMARALAQQGETPEITTLTFEERLGLGCSIMNQATATTGVSPRVFGASRYCSTGLSFTQPLWNRARTRNGSMEDDVYWLPVRASSVPAVNFELTRGILHEHDCVKPHVGRVGLLRLRMRNPASSDEFVSARIITP